MEATLEGGYLATIVNGGVLLRVLDQTGAEICSIYPPEHSLFYQFSKHAMHGECLIVSFEPTNKFNGWQDWYLKIDVQAKSITRLNPWR